VNRALRAATMGVLLLSPIALSACSAGQVTQTATQERDKVGAMASVGSITLREVELAYPSSGQYEQGDDARVRMAIVNSGSESDTLVDVSGDGFTSAEISGASTRAPLPAATVTPSASAGATPPASGSPSPTATAPSATATSAGATSSSAAAGQIEIPAGTTVLVGQGGGISVTLTGLDQSLTTGQRVQLVFTFEKAGEITVDAPVANPNREESRGDSFDFHQSENG
jgi:copper(I)-binding protein